MKRMDRIAESTFDRVDWEFFRFQALIQRAGMARNSILFIPFILFILSNSFRRSYALSEPHNHFLNPRRRGMSIAWANRPGWLSAEGPLLWHGTPGPRDAAWWERVNEPLSNRDWQRLRHSVLRGRPFGNDDWTRPTAQSWGLESCLRPPGRPKKS